MEKTSHKKITLCLSKIDILLQLKITDNGRGIPHDILSKIGCKGFSFGQQNHTTAGSGLGVHNAIELIKSWGGEFYISSRINVGTEVVIKLKEANGG